MGVDQISVTTSLHRSKCVHGKRIAQIGDDGSTWTYDQLYSRVSALAASLFGHIIRKDDRVAVLALNSFRYTELMYAIPWCNGIIVPLNFRLAYEELKYILQDCEATVLFVDEAWAEVGERLASISDVKLVLLGNEQEKEKAGFELSHEGMIAANIGGMKDCRRGGDDVYGIFYTGGTTGRPKGVMLTHGNIAWNALGTMGMLGFNNNTRYLHIAPMFHLADAQCVFASVLASGIQMYMPRFTPEGALKTIDKFSATKIVLVPSMITMMLNVEGDFNLTSLDTINYGASSMPEALLARAMTRFPSCQFLQGYGMTETSPAIAILLPQHHVGERLRSVGQPVPWAEAKIMDENDRDVEPGIVGEIVTRGAHVMKGYWKMPDATAEALRNGWMHTGDAGYMDADGFLWIVDRIKDMIITGGENVYSAEVENAIMQCDNVQQVAVIGVPDEKFGELVTAVIVPTPSMTVDPEELKAHCKQRIAGYKCPRNVVIREMLPISGTGKVLKKQLRIQLATVAP